MRCVKVNPEDAETLRLFRAFYDDIYAPAFPNPDESETFESFCDMIVAGGADSPYVQALLFYQADEPLGGVIFDYFAGIRALTVEFIVVAEEHRGRGVASAILDYAIEYVRSRGNPVDWLFIEIERPACVKNGDYAYLRFWKKHGMRAVDFAYIQPALGPGKRPVDTLLLCARGPSGANEIETARLKEFLYCYAHHAMEIENPLADPSVQKMYQALDARGAASIALLAL